MEQEPTWLAFRAAATPRWSRLDVVGSTARLLREVSYDNFDGRGHEDVLTTEIFHALDLLPRKPFLTNVWAGVHGLDDNARQVLVSAAESSQIITLPGDLSCVGKAAGKVQPDVLIESDEAVVSVEAKRLKQSRFDPTQLARQALLLSKCAESKPAFLWVVVGQPPIIKLGKLGKQSLRDALQPGLEKICEPMPADDLFQRFGEALAWSTWSEIVSICRTTQQNISPEAEELRECTGRLVSSMEQALQWHA